MARKVKGKDGLRRGTERELKGKLPPKRTSRGAVARHGVTCKADDKCQTQESYIGRCNIEEKSDSKKDIRLQMAILEKLACASSATLPTLQSIHVLTTHDFVGYHSTYVLLHDLPPIL